MRLARRSASRAVRVGAPVARLAVDPPLVPPAWRPLRRFESWGRDWQERRGAIVRGSVDATTDLAANAAEVVLPMVDLTPVVNGVLERLDLDAVSSAALESLDLASVIAQVLDEVDVGEVLNEALTQVDLTEVVVEQVALGEVVRHALDEVDLTEIVVSRVDLAAVVNAALGRLDLTAIVQQHVDLPVIAEQVIDDVDLPQIIQESTGSVASEAIVSARLTSVDADQALSRFADRVLRRARRRVESGAALEAEGSEDVDDR